MKTVEKSPAVAGQGGWDLAPLQCLAEPEQVNVQRCRIQVEVAIYRGDHFGAEGSAEVVDQHVEAMADRGRIALGPEVGHQLVAAYGPAGGADQQGEGRDRVAVTGPPRKRLSSLFDGSPAEEPDDNRFRYQRAEPPEVRKGPLRG